MATHEEKIEIMRKYYLDIRTTFEFHIKGEIPSKIIDNALKKFAHGMDRTTIIGFYDTTVMNSGKNGYIITDDKVYYLESFEKPKKLWYEDISEVVIGNTHKQKDCDRSLTFHMVDGTSITWTSNFLNKTPLRDFFVDIMATYKEQPNQSTAVVDFTETSHHIGAEAAGLGVGNYQNINQSFDEEKFHSRQGHGFAAERANNLYDKLAGHNARIVGDDNKANGADRILDGVEIQSKYCATGSRCINECFENDGKGGFRYYNQQGAPMKIEVPSDKYDDAVRAMEEKIKRGQVDGVTDPQEAKDIVKRGNFTYEQAKNIAKAGTVESLSYDAVNGAIIATSAFGVSAMISFATSLWNGEDFDIALKTATYSGLKVGGTAFVTRIIAGQLSKAGLNSALVESSEAVVQIMGPKASALLINAFRDGSNIYGAAAMKSAAKLLRGNAITSGVTVLVLSSVDIVNIFRGRISGKQLFKNLVNTTATVSGGGAGMLIGSAILPGVGTVIGGFIGGMLAQKASDTVVGSFVEDDAEEMTSIMEKRFGILAEDYLLSRKEAEKVADVLHEKLTGSILRDMFASSNRTAYADNILQPIIEKEVDKRKFVSVPDEVAMNHALIAVLEEITDHMEPTPA